ncbi:MAG: hypothetical protein LKF75_04290 [Bacilli bacterium]|nr:hypothetical protein [Bacilli bacterium]MCH4228893.1 hypothetical protein [Bacilli bacterium]
MDVKSMIPFLDDDELFSLANKIIDSEDGTYGDVDLKQIIPFIDDDDLPKLLAKAYNKGMDVTLFYPFMDEDDLTGFMKIVLDSGRKDFNFRPLLPFLDEDGLDYIGEYLKNGGDLQGMSLKDIFPFLEDDAVDALFLEAAERNDPELSKLAVFVSDDGWHQLAKGFVEGKYQNLDLNSLYVFMDDDDIKLIFKKMMNG